MKKLSHALYVRMKLRDDNCMHARNLGFNKTWTKQEHKIFTKAWMHNILANKQLKQRQKQLQGHLTELPEHLVSSMTKHSCCTILHANTNMVSIYLLELSPMVWTFRTNSSAIISSQISQTISLNPETL